MLKFCIAVLAFAVAVTASIPSHASPASCSEEIERGVASWYGPGFEGAKTKSEEIFNPASLSAAHPDLPFGTVLKVTNLRNHRSVNVRVNDRGGFSKERVIDVSTSAATELGMIDEGTAAVAIYRCNE
jgi:rare lipoprotein A